MLAARNFSRQTRRMATMVAPAEAQAMLANGRGALVDVRITDGGVTFHPNATNLPYEAVLGRDRGLEEVPGDVTRDELLSGLENAALGEAEYHEAANVTLEQARAATNNPKMTHTEAQAYVKQVNEMLDNPKAFAKFYSGFSTDSSQSKRTALKSAYAGKGKPSAEIDAFVTAQREGFKRFMDMKVVEQNRFSPAPASEQEAADRAFSYVFVRSVRPALGGAKLDHAGVAAALKKKCTAAALKSNKAFVESFFLAFSQDLDKALLDNTIARLSGEKEALTEHLEFAAKQRSAWSWYLTYSEKPSKAQLAANLTDAHLMRLAGRLNANLGDHAKTAQANLAKEALSALPTARPLILLCDAQAHSERVATALEAAGANDIQVVEGGADRWLLEGVPATFSKNLTSQIDDALKVSMTGAPTGLQDINE